VNEPEKWLAALEIIRAAMNESDQLEMADLARMPRVGPRHRIDKIAALVE
jgi:hypothetical protein